MKRAILVCGAVFLAGLAASPGRADTMVDGTISDAGWGGDYTRWTGETFTPESTPVRIEGWVELSNLTPNGAIMVGLLDKQWIDDGHSSYMGGAYAYFANIGGTTYRIGPSDGNLGGEIVQTFINVPVNPTGPNQIDFLMVLNADTIELTVLGNTLTDDYGVIKDMNSTTAYPWDEFEFGAYLGADLWSPNGSIDYHLEATQVKDAVIPEPSSALLLVMALVGSGAYACRRRKDGFHRA